MKRGERCTHVRANKDQDTSTAIYERNRVNIGNRSFLEIFRSQIQRRRRDNIPWEFEVARCCSSRYV
ncbi:hypothetical protein ANTRET_LOCUS8621 [Anthophora retusa]